MNCLAWLCSVAVGVTGYEAVIECSSVQDERPSSSTSGGQSDGGAAAMAELIIAAVAPALLVFFVWEAQSAKEVQERQLRDR